MKVHYINILLFALPLNILLTLYHEHSKNEPHTTPRHTQKITITRLLCECELYARANYDNDPQMKKVMDNFNKQTQQRFQEYDDRMVEKRKQCKEKCDKEIEKIILKDKLEKQMAEQFATLRTDIQSDDIPTCVCKKSVADKVEEGCLRCAQNLGGILAPSSGVLAGIAEGALILWKPLALDAAKATALAEATDLATKAGIDAVVSKLKQLFDLFRTDKFTFDLSPIVTSSTYKDGTALLKSAKEVLGNSCTIPGTRSDYSFCTTAIKLPSDYNVGNFGKIGSDAFEKTLESQTTALTDAKVGVVNITYGGCQTAIIASIVAIVVIVLIMVIIYLILRYRRKKKMKKKLQYIKLLEE
ncbi:rifin PIR protein, putative [Plasmodium reichenowi]|uniref:Rifin PIR protein, putative n=1 Tax=Plasmodium reichenowi TaxID=5854 RepID=A0A2P9DHE9_PLARE|nr:rifin PIR protein, putative [Plasmodium reichenowi]